MLHFAVYLEDYTCSVYFSVQLEPTEVKQEGVNTEAFFFFLYSFVPHLPPAVLAYIFIARRVRPSLSLVDHEAEVCVLTKLFSYCRFLPPDTKVRKKPLPPRFEPVIWVPEGYEDTN